MNFTKVPKNQNNPDGAKFSVYLEYLGYKHYVCDMTDSTAAEDIAANELGLTLRARLTRSRGKYAMLEGTIFNPERLLDAACEITDYKKEEFTGGDYKDGYTLLTITADYCVNTYMIFDKKMLFDLVGKLEKRIKPATD